MMYCKPDSFSHEPRGFTLLIAVVLTTVLVSVGLALFDVAYKQIVLTSAARQSQYAFYAADSGLECALFWDQKFNAFGGSNPQSTIRCGNTDISVSSAIVSGRAASVFTMPCLDGRTSSVTVIKAGEGNTCNTRGSRSCLYANGFSSCNAADNRRIERGLQAFY